MSAELPSTAEGALIGLQPWQDVGRRKFISRMHLDTSSGKAELGFTFYSDFLFALPSTPMSVSRHCPALHLLFVDPAAPAMAAHLGSHFSLLPSLCGPGLSELRAELTSSAKLSVPQLFCLCSLLPHSLLCPPTGIVVKLDYSN